VPRKKRVEVKEQVKTSLEIALEQAEAEDIAPKPAPPKAKRKRKKKSTPPATEVSVTNNDDFVRYVPPKLKMRKKGVNYKEGDAVEINQGGDLTQGEIVAILASQIVVRTEDDRELFFFQSGLNIRKLSA